ncbi:PAS domain S-box protein [Halodesulfovibrio aestuarii]|uniref:PAS domain S-box-containing protein n=1 Tax=Halodesulfovibrio aestuarii TaxID=126333 RepID=A0A8G2CC87_9BACT|nr:PAS domain S-box protein [Halodesulfovibrio aestuarii]SHJ74594.1 PAS domain S-box-containing protein [Halodesulfovibrio aestuarii]
MRSPFKQVQPNISRKKHSIGYWWSAIFILFLTFFSCIFFLSGYYLQASHYHQDFIAKGIETSKQLSSHLAKELEEHQATIHYLAQDDNLLTAIAMDDEPELLKWVRAVPNYDHKQIYFIQSAKTNNIFSFSQPPADIRDVLRHTTTYPNFSIYRSSSNQFLLCLTQPLRVEGTIVGVLGSIFPVNLITESIELNKKLYSILIMEDGKFTDIFSGKRVTLPITLLQNAIQQVTIPALFNHENVAIPIGMNQLYLYAHTQTLIPNLSIIFFTWLFLCLPGCIIAYALALKLSKSGTRSLQRLTSLTGDIKKDRCNLLELAEHTSMAEISFGAQKLIKYCDMLIKSQEYKRHTALFKACTTALIICDLEGKILEWNDEVNILLGGAPKNLFGLPVKELFASTDQLQVVTGMAHVRQSINTPLDSNNMFKARLRLNSVRKRSQHVETVIKHIQHANCSSLVFMLYNITKHVLTEQGLQRAKNTAEKITKERHHFYMGLTQEIEPLAEALNQSLIQLSETQPSKTQQRHMEQLQFHNELLSELITNIRDFALLETGSVFFERSIFDIETLLRQVHASTYSRAMQAQADVCIYLDPAVPQQIWFDFSKSLRVISNLINIAAKRVHRGMVLLTVTAGELRSNHVQILFEVCSQKGAPPENHPEYNETGTLPQLEYYGEKSQQLSLAIIERIINRFSIQLAQNVTSSDAHVFSLEASLTPLSPLRVDFHPLLKGKKILLTYCQHNTINFIGRALSRLGAICTFTPIEDHYFEEIIEAQHSYDVIITCGCAFEAIPEKSVNKHFQKLTTTLYAITHSYWEPTYSHPQIESFRKPIMINELLAKLSGKLLPRVGRYEATGSALTPDLVLIIAKKSDHTDLLQQKLKLQGYTTAHVEDVTKSVDARQLYQPELILLDTENITLDSFWVIKDIREMEKKERLEPSRIVIFISQEHTMRPEYIDPYTLTLKSNTTSEELLSHLTSLKNTADNTRVA